MMSDETVAMSCVIKDDAEAENLQASIWNASVTEGSSTQQTTQRTGFQSPDRVWPKKKKKKKAKLW